MKDRFNEKLGALFQAELPRDAWFGAAMAVALGEAKIQGRTLEQVQAFVKEVWEADCGARIAKQLPKLFPKRPVEL